jgi:hypothetical protein
LKVKYNLIKKVEKSFNNYEITEKIDGTMGIIFLYKNEFHVSTKKKLDSYQSIMLKNWLNKNIDKNLFIEGI